MWVYVADVDGDGYGEVYITGNTTIYALRGTDGSVIWTYPAGSTYGNIAIGDINNDGQHELITVAGGNLLVLRATNGTLLWSYSVGGQGNPVLADLDNDGFLEIVVATASGNVYAFRYSGTPYWNRNYGCGSYWGNLNSPTAGDINGDGMIEILFGCIPSSTSGRVYALRGTDGSIIWSYTGTVSGYQALSRKIGDIDNDGQVEVIVSGARYGSSPHLVILRGTDGRVKWTYVLDYFEGLSIADVDNDGCMELVSNCDFASSTFYIFDSPVPVSDCGVLGYDDPISVDEGKSKGLYLSVMGSRGGVIVETGKSAEVEIYNTSGRKVKVVRVIGKTFVDLKAGVYVLKVKDRPIYKAFVVKE
ncbi:MAG: FG-GAP-like repeat-containing protein [candidate division WOR-3 bacterium]